MIMPTRLRARRAAGLEPRAPVTRREAGNIELLEGCRRHRGDLLPAFQRLRPDAAGGAQAPERLIMRVLKGEQLAREQIEQTAIRLRIALSRSKELLQMRGVMGEISVVHAVFEYGWFSATAGPQSIIPNCIRQGSPRT